MEKYIINPKTGRVVLREGKIGKQILETSSKTQLKNLTNEYKEREKIRVKVAKCNYGEIFSTVNGRKCVPRKSENGITAVKCQQEITRKALRDFKDGILDPKIKTAKQVLGISLKSSQTQC